MIRAHKIRLDPNNKQATLLLKSCGVARFAYNWALDMWKEQYAAYVKDPKANPRPTEAGLRKHLNSIKREQFPWMLEVSKCAPQCAIMNLGVAFDRFFQKKSKYPTFHKKGRRDSFSFDTMGFRLTDTYIGIPKVGRVRICESLRFSGKVLGCTVSRVADQWYISVQVELPDVKPTVNKGPSLGIDWGSRNFSTLSTGDKFEGPKPHKKMLVKQRKLNKSLSRKQKGSHNWVKAKVKLAKLHNHTACIRKDFVQKFTTNICRHYYLIGVETLGVTGMVKTTLARSVLDQAPYEVRRQLTYKAPVFGSTLVAADRFFPSSKLCSCCGHKLDFLPRDAEEWVCPVCRAHHDRDVNAALNLKDYAEESLRPKPVEHLALTAGPFPDVKPGAGKQEETTFRYGSKW